MLHILRDLQRDRIGGFVASEQPHQAVPPKRALPGNDNVYWEKRARAVYLQHVNALVHFLARDAKSIIDVGSNGCPYLEWFSWIPRKVSVDLHNPYSSDTVQGVKADFFSFPAENFDFCTCLQVLEHIPDADLFARKLLATSAHVLISVPYKWPSGKCKGHVHDPVDEEKVAAWFGTEPTFSMVSKEFGGASRLICYFGRAPSFSEFVRPHLAPATLCTD